jgi:hypothetical protein
MTIMVRASQLMAHFGIAPVDLRMFFTVDYFIALERSGCAVTLANRR